MEKITLNPQYDSKKQVVVLPLFTETTKQPVQKALQGLSAVQKLNFEYAQKSGHLPKSGIFPVFSSESLILVYMLGEEKKFLRREAREAGEHIFALTKKYQLSELAILPGALTKELWIAFREGVVLGAYEFTKWHGTKKKPSEKESKLQKLQFIEKKDAATERSLELLAEAVRYAKDIINEPPFNATPSYLEDIARMFAKKLPRVEVTVLKEKELEKLGCGGLMAVGRGSDEESRLIILNYKGGKAQEKPLAFIGKGVTYDTGGLSLKPSPHMASMKQDLGGAATILGAFWAIVHSGIKKNILVAIPTTENLINDKAYKPDDVLKMYNGVTVEVTNTDAEGRLILADALAYVEDKYKPRAMVDLATLTGACLYAVGTDFSAYLVNEPKLGVALKKAATEVDEPIWELPLHERYSKMLDSPIADIVNSSHKLKAGTIEGALFLKNFVKDTTPWCHMDIASVAFDDAKGMATGRNVRLLWHFAEIF